jgi:hypothetical protein
MEFYCLYLFLKDCLKNENVDKTSVIERSQEAQKVIRSEIQKIFLALDYGHNIHHITILLSWETGLKGS